MSRTEYQEQRIVVKWCEVMSFRYKGLDTIFHIPNEAKRSVQTAAMLKATGMKAGVPDLFLPVAIGNYHGLFIEMKSEKGKPSKLQTEWLHKLSEQGYKTAICYGADEAVKTIERYYKGE